MKNTDVGRLYEDYARHVYQFLLRLCGDSHLAEDLMQDTFLKAVEKIHTFDNRCDITTWLCSIAKNCFYDHLRKKKHSPFTAEELPESRDPSPTLEEMIISGEADREIRRIIHKLEEPYKEVFLLRFYADLPFREIGLTFDKSEVWARVTYLRSKEKILQELQKRKDD